MVALILLIALNWADIGAAFGFGMAQRRRMRRKRSRYSFLISVFMWVIAILVLMERPGTIFNPFRTNSTITDIIGEGATPPNPLQVGDFLPTVSSLVQNSWFSIAFLGLVVVGGLVLVQSVRIALKETSEMSLQDLQVRQTEGLQATQEAIRLIDDKTADPRSRIISCFQYMLGAMSRLGVPISSDQTARELEQAIRSTLALRGAAVGELTQLFEEARYSLHEINEEDSEHAHHCLESIAEELKIQISS